MKKEVSEKKASRRKMSKKAKRRIVALVLVGGVAVYLFASSRMKSSQPVMVTTTQALRGDIEQTLSTSGTVGSEKVKTYFSPVGATIQDVSVELGDMVSTGDMLVSYNVSDLELEMEQAAYRTQAAVNTYLGTSKQNNQNSGKYAEASTDLAVLEQQIADQKIVIKELENNLETLELEAEAEKEKYKKKDLELQQKLLTEQANLSSASSASAQEQINWRIRDLNSQITQNNYEMAQVDVNPERKERKKVLEDALEAAKDTLTRYEEARSEAKSQKSTAESTASNAYNEASLNASANETKLSEQIAADNLAAAQGGVAAEFEGIVTAVSAKEGALATEGMELLEVQSNREVCVKVEVTKYDLERIAVGQKADVTIAGKAYEGSISKIYHMATKNTSGSSVVQALIHIDNPDDDIFLGIEAKVVIHTDESKGTIMVPVEVVNADMNGDFVYVVENGIVTRRDVVAGISSDLYMEILEGLSEGEEVIMDSSFVTEGMAVAVYSPEAQTE